MKETISEEAILEALDATKTVEEQYIGQQYDRVLIAVPLQVVTNNFIGSAISDYRVLEDKINGVYNDSISLKCIQYTNINHGGYTKPEMVEIVFDRDEAQKLKEFLENCIALMPDKSNQSQQ